MMDNAQTGGYWNNPRTFSTEYSHTGVSRQIVNLTRNEGNAPRGRKVRLLFYELDTYQMISVSEVSDDGWDTFVVYHSRSHRSHSQPLATKRNHRVGI